MSGTMRSAFHRCGQFFNMDATYKTNRFGMQLVLLVGATEILSTAVFAMALILTESTASYNWVLGEVRTAVGEEAWRAVRCVATDGAGCFHAVIEENLPWATHLRCRFHIRTNINKNLRLLYKGDSSSWQLFLRGYYRCINEPSEVRFEQLWTTLMQAHPRVVEYMTKEVYSHRKQLASCYTNKYVTLGAQSTQRGEGMNALIKAWIIPSLPLSYLCEVVKGMSDRQAAKVLLSLCDNRYTPPDRDGPVYEDARKVLTKQAAWLVDVEGSARESYEVRWFAQQPAIPWTHDVHVNDVGVPDVSELPPATPYRILSILQSGVQSNIQLTLDSHYTVPSTPLRGGWLVTMHPSRRTPGSHLPHWVEVSQSRASCSGCHFATKFLLPCRHILAVNLREWPGSAFQPGQCHPRWKIEAVHAPTVTTTVIASSSMIIDSVMDDTVCDSRGKEEQQFSHNMNHTDLIAHAHYLSSRLHGYPRRVWVLAYERIREIAAELCTPAPASKSRRRKLPPEQAQEDILDPQVVTSKGRRSLLATTPSNAINNTPNADGRPRRQRRGASTQ
jgi:hypothetical protein